MCLAAGGVVLQVQQSSMCRVVLHVGSDVRSSSIIMLYVGGGGRSSAVLHVAVAT